MGAAAAIPFISSIAQPLIQFLLGQQEQEQSGILRQRTIDLFNEANLDFREFTDAQTSDLLQGFADRQSNLQRAGRQEAANISETVSRRFGSAKREALQGIGRSGLSGTTVGSSLGQGFARESARTEREALGGLNARIRREQSEASLDQLSAQERRFEAGTIDPTRMFQAIGGF